VTILNPLDPAEKQSSPGDTLAVAIVTCTHATARRRHDRRQRLAGGSTTARSTTCRAGAPLLLDRQGHHRAHAGRRADLRSRPLRPPAHTTCDSPGGVPADAGGSCAGVGGEVGTALATLRVARYRSTRCGRSTVRTYSRPRASGGNGDRHLVPHRIAAWSGNVR